MLTGDEWRWEQCIEMVKHLLHELLNTTTEVHATVYGLYAGITEWKGAELPDDSEVQDEMRYWMGGYICGTAFRWTAILLIGGALV